MARPLPTSFSSRAGLSSLLNVALTFASMGFTTAFTPMVPNSPSADFILSRYAMALSLPRSRYSPGWQSAVTSAVMPNKVANSSDGSPNSLQLPAAQVATTVPPLRAQSAIDFAAAPLMQGSAV